METSSPSESKKRSKHGTRRRSETSPAAPILFYRALSFASAADAYVQAHRKDADFYMTNFLLARAFELALKAILRADGISAAELASRRFGHDLIALIGECKRRSIEIVDPAVPDSTWGNQDASQAAKPLSRLQITRPLRAI